MKLNLGIAINYFLNFHSHYFTLFFTLILLIQNELLERLTYMNITRNVETGNIFTKIY